jgi:hypothetical protein
MFHSIIQLLTERKKKKKNNDSCKNADIEWLEFEFETLRL